MLYGPSVYVLVRPSFFFFGLFDVALSVRSSLLPVCVIHIHAMLVIYFSRKMWRGQSAAWSSICPTPERLVKTCAAWLSVVVWLLVVYCRVIMKKKFSFQPLCVRDLPRSQAYNINMVRDGAMQFFVHDVCACARLYLSNCSVDGARGGFHWAAAHVQGLLRPARNARGEAVALHLRRLFQWGRRCTDICVVFCLSPMENLGFLYPNSSRPPCG